MVMRRMHASAGPQDAPGPDRFPQILRWVLLLLVLLAFARLTWQLDGKALWWDESLSLQRAESSWLDLLLGRLPITDGFTRNVTIDQHPFGYFVLLGLWIRLAGIQEFALRFPSVMAATLLVPSAWAFARHLAGRGAVAPSAPIWAGLLAALNPFLLWYGQEARMYTLVALLAVISTLALLRWSEAQRVADPGAGRRLWGYGASLLALLSSHYFAVLLMPVHALVIVRRLSVRHRRWAWLLGGGLLAGGGLLVGGAAWVILRQPGSGENFAPVSPAILLPDLLNAFSLGLSVDIDDVRWLDGLFGLVALLGLTQGWPGSVGRRPRLDLRWVLLGFVLAPPSLLLLIGLVRPAYMNARHMSLIAGGFIVLVGAGLGWLWQRRPWLGVGVAGILVAGMLVSSANYFQDPRYGKDDFPGLGRYLRQELQPGDLLLLDPPELQRLYRYYLPLDLVEAGQRAGQGARWQSVPLLCHECPSPRLFPLLEELRQQHRRIWLVTSGMFPFSDPEKQIEAWLQEHAFRVREKSFASTTSFLELDLFLPQLPLVDEMPLSATPVNAQFGEEIRLLGYQVGRSLGPGSAVPLTLYWQALKPLERRYKYVAQLVPVEGEEVFPPTEREPYDGFLPTIWWPQDRIVVELSQLAGPDPESEGTHRLRLLVFVYDSESLERLAVISTKAGQVADGTRLLLPYP